MPCPTERVESRDVRSIRPGRQCCRPGSPQAASESGKGAADLGVEQMSIAKPKSGKARIVPMTGALAAALRAHRHLPWRPRPLPRGRGPGSSTKHPLRVGGRSAIRGPRRSWEQLRPSHGGTLCDKIAVQLRSLRSPSRRSPETRMASLALVDGLNAHVWRSRSSRRSSLAPCSSSRASGRRRYPTWTIFVQLYDRGEACGDENTTKTGFWRLA